MCVEAAPKSGCKKTSCGCGGHGRQAFVATQSDPRAILALKFGEEAEQKCDCSSGNCPRHYLAITGFILVTFVVLHLVVNMLGLWPARFQTAVNHIHGLGAALPILEIGLIFIPLAIHVAFGLRTLRREKLKFDVEKHLHGSDLRQWLQRVTAVILLAFIAFHLATMHRWGLNLVFRLTHWPVLERYAAGGLFEPSRAFASVRDGLGNFWSAASGHPANLLVAQFYLLGITSAVYHLANGVATGSEVLGFTTTPAAQQRLWRLCLVTAPLLLLTGIAAWYAFAVK
jgi:succinate dehydrogenase / fumarate reductase cytochrome b subunit